MDTKTLAAVAMMGSMAPLLHSTMVGPSTMPRAPRYAPPKSKAVQARRNKNKAARKARKK